MENWWLKVGCFLTGYNYNILDASSEISAKAVKRYTSALLIVCILWSFIGYVFTQRYLKANFFGCAFGSIILCVIIIQIERQIILAVHKNWKLYAFRALIAITMAIIGSVIIDQIIFKEDIEQKQIFLLDAKVNSVLPAKEKEIRSQANQLDSIITKKEQDRKIIVDDISLHPTIKTVTSQSNAVPIQTTTTDSLKALTTKTSLVRTNSFTISSIQNPKMALLNPLDIQISGLRNQKARKDSALIALRPKIEKEISSRIGFLDELQVMYKLISESGVALAVWLLWFLFLLCIELFIMVSKMGEEPNDYDATIFHQMDLQKKKLNILSIGMQSKST
ncbi:DUF4407 domain-containing protein [Mucilaginibacter lappiensis]|uniref:DUF4407 domain-containing protein n=1 Tax=Mucilaginibacter lappiensis TaxID=354630 RepID=UPI003D1D03E9